MIAYSRKLILRIQNVQFHATILISLSLNSNVVRLTTGLGISIELIYRGWPITNLQIV